MFLDVKSTYCIVAGEIKEPYVLDAKQERATSLYRAFYTIKLCMDMIWDCQSTSINISKQSTCTVNNLGLMKEHIMAINECELTIDVLENIFSLLFLQYSDINDTTKATCGAAENILSSGNAESCMDSWESTGSSRRINRTTIQAGPLFLVNAANLERILYFIKDCLPTFTADSKR